MNKAYTGGCACGAIRFEIADEPLFLNHCQRLDCQHASGTGHGSYLTHPRCGVTQSGDAMRWDMVGDSGNVKTRTTFFDPRISGLHDVCSPARCSRRSRSEPRRSRSVQAATRHLRGAAPGLGPPRSCPTQIRQDAAALNGRTWDLFFEGMVSLGRSSDVNRRTGQ